jgi:hypothetical protein
MPNTPLPLIATMCVPAGDQRTPTTPPAKEQSQESGIKDSSGVAALLRTSHTSALSLDT